MDFKLSKSSKIFDQMVPIVKKDNNSDVYLLNEIGPQDEYAELCHRLYNAKKDETFTLHLNTPGGYIDSALMIIDAINTSKATVNARISGSVASAGTILTLACKNVVVSDHVSFMIHNYSSGMAGKGHEMKAYQQFVDKNLNVAFKAMYKGFLTEEEVDEIIEGKDLWLNKQEVEERLARR